jgi:nucleoside-diphosphate-sugar epimerase
MSVSKSIIITGANGFIGQHLVAECIEQGMQVFAAVRKGSNIGQLGTMKCTVVEIEYSHVESIATLIAKINPTYIIHNAGLTRTPDYKEFLKVNRDYLIHIVAGIRQSGVTIQKLLFVSSLAAYGPADFQLSGIVTHTSTPHPVTNYGRSKLAAEQWLWQQKDIPFNIIRPTAVFGPGEKDLLQVFQMIQSGINLMAGFGSQKLTFIYAKDLVRMMVSAVTTSQTHQAYFASDGKVYRGEDFPEAIQEALGKQVLTLKMPVFIIRMGAHISALIGKITGKFPTLYPERVNEIQARSWACDTENIKNDLGFAAQYTLQQAIHETVRWYQKEGWLKS